MLWGDGFEIETVINCRFAAAGVDIVEVPSLELLRMPRRVQPQRGQPTACGCCARCSPSGPRRARARPVERPSHRRPRELPIGVERIVPGKAAAA